MTAFSTHKSLACFGLTALLAITAATAQVASGTTGIDASGDTQREKAACTSGKTQQDKATCLTETRNAAADKRAGKLDNASAQFAANALKRCDVFKGDDDKAACQARVTGRGKIDGSVAGGGVLREIETVVTAPSAAPVSLEPQTQSPVVKEPQQ